MITAPLSAQPHSSDSHSHEDVMEAVIADSHVDKILQYCRQYTSRSLIGHGATIAHDSL
jgi:hypothetical protein